MATSKWIDHVKAVAQKLKMNYSQALKDPRTKASYGGKMKGGAFWKDFGRGFGNGFIGTANIAKGIATQDTDLIEKGANRVVGGALRLSADALKKLSNRTLKEMLKERHLPLTKKLGPGKYKQYTQEDMIQILMKKKKNKDKIPLQIMEQNKDKSGQSINEAEDVINQISSIIDTSNLPIVEKDEIESLIELLKRLSGGNIKQARKWTDYAVDTAKQGIGLYKMIKGGNVKKARKWTDYAVDTAKQGIGLYKMIKGGKMKRKIKNC